MFQYPLCRVVMINRCTIAIATIAAMFQYPLCRVVMINYPTTNRQRQTVWVSVPSLSGRDDQRLPRPSGPTRTSEFQYPLCRVVMINIGSPYGSPRWHGFQFWRKDAQLETK